MRAEQLEPATRPARKVGVRLALVTVLPLLSLLACSSDTPTAPSTAGTDGLLAFSTAHFDIHLYDGLVRADVEVVAGRLELEYRRIVDDLQVASMPRVNVGIWSNQTSFNLAMMETIGTVYVGAGGYILGPAGFRLLMIGTPAQNAVHEFAHVVTLNVNRNFSNNPRWLWEAVAVYEAGEFFEPASLPYMRPGNFPTLEQLNVDYDQGYWIYQVGYVLIEYIVETWGMDAVIALIETHGDIQGVLGITVVEFEHGWDAWLTSEYF